MTFLDRIKVTSTSTGTGTFTLGGAVLGYKVFSNGTYKYCIVNDTESEWEVGEGTVASGVLTRTTIEASSNGGAAVSFSAGTKQVFNTVSAAYVNSLVPYTGATASVNLGEYGLTAGQLTLDTSPTGTAVVGTTRWNDTIGSSETLLKGGNVLLKDGVDLVARVVNKVSPNATLTKAAYKAVRVSGAQGQRLAVAYAQANNDNNSADTIGLVCETIATNQEGFIITVGQLLDVNTTGSLQGETWADGDVLYLSPTTAGNLTNIKPNGSTGHIVVIGYVEYAHANNGKIYVKIMNGWELTELHDTYISSVANNDVLVYESSTTLWKNKSIATILGYTPQAAITLTTTGTSGAATLIGNTLNIPQYASGISGSGTTGQVTYWTGTSAVGGSSTLTYTPTTSFLVNNSVTASSAIARGVNFTPTLTAAANNDVLVGLDIAPTTNKGAFTGVLSTGIRINGNNIAERDSPNNHKVLISATSNGISRMYFDSTATGAGWNTGFSLSATNISKWSIAGYGLTYDFTIYNDSLSAAALFIKGSTNNVSIGSTSDSGYRLDVNGTGASTGALRVTGGSTLIVGGGNTSATNALVVQNSSATNLFTVRNDGAITISATSSASVTNGMTITLAAGYTGTARTDAIIGTNSAAGTGQDLNTPAINSGGSFSAIGTTIGFNVGGRFISFGSSTKNIGFYGDCTVTSSGDNIGAFARGLNSTGKQVGGFFAISGSSSFPTISNSAALISDNGSSSSDSFIAQNNGVSVFKVKSNGRINMSSLPTSSAGLSAGDLWNNLGVINIV